MDGNADDRQTLVVIGNGMVGFRLCRQLVECGAAPGPLRLLVFGEEPRPAYDRVHLTELFAGRSEEDLCLAPETWYRDAGIDLRLGDPVVSIDRQECLVRSASGAVVPFDRLVLATGSRPFVPPVPGTDLPGVFVYRTVDDLRAIREHARGDARAAVIGGGLLGLEAARAVQELGLEVHIVEASRGLLARQLDEAGAALLRRKVEAMGLHVHAGARTTRIEEMGSERLVHLDDGGCIAVDLVVLSAGIRPRDELARAAGLALASGGGVIVDDHLVSSDPRIFAVGECASHRGVIYGQAAPGYRMIDVLVDNLVGGNAAFPGADASARLKLAGVSVAALGRYEEGEGTLVHAFQSGDVYRKLLLREGRIVGAVAVGEWPDLARVSAAIEEPRRTSFWDLRRFRSTGTLWLASESAPVHEWPPDAVVCGCLGIRLAALTEAELLGCDTAAELSARTGAGTVCGSCRPLLVDLVQRTRIESMPPSRLTEWAITRRAAGADSEDDPPVETPPTLRCSLPPKPRPLSDDALPPSTRSAIYLHANEAARMLSTHHAHHAHHAHPDDPTLPSIDITGLSLALAPLPSLHMDDVVPSSRRDSMVPLRPLSVPPSRITGRPPGRLAPSVTGATPPDRTRTPLLAAAAATLLGVVVLALVPGLPPARSFRGLHADVFLTSRPLREASGYAVVALALASLVLSLRKRWQRFAYGSVAGLRVVHSALGVAALVGLACHTGLHTGERLNRLLALDFVAAAALGGLAAAATALAHPLSGATLRLLVTRAHLFVLLPLPVLVALHVLGAYYF